MKDIYNQIGKTHLYKKNKTDIKIASKISKLVKDCRMICDIGFGNTVLAEMLKKNNPEFNYCGIDIDNECVEKSKEKSLGKNIHFFHGCLNDVDTSQIDCFIMSRVIHHMSPQEFKMIIHDIMSKIKKGGELIIVDSIRDYTNRPDRKLYLPFYIFTQTIQYLPMYDISSKCVGEAVFNKYWIMKLNITKGSVEYLLEFIE